MPRIFWQPKVTRYGGLGGGIFSLKIQSEVQLFFLMGFPLQLLRCFEILSLIITNTDAVHTSVTDNCQSHWFLLPIYSKHQVKSTVTCLSDCLFEKGSLKNRCQILGESHYLLWATISEGRFCIWLLSHWVKSKHPSLVFVYILQPAPQPSEQLETQLKPA